MERNTKVIQAIIRWLPGKNKTGCGEKEQMERKDRM